MRILKRASLGRIVCQTRVRSSAELRRTRGVLLVVLQPGSTVGIVVVPGGWGGSTGGIVVVPGVVGVGGSTVGIVVVPGGWGDSTGGIVVVPGVRG